jgi:hypothetical protein
MTEDHCIVFEVVGGSDRSPRATVHPKHRFARQPSPDRGMPIVRVSTPACPDSAAGFLRRRCSRFILPVKRRDSGSASSAPECLVRKYFRPQARKANRRSMYHRSERWRAHGEEGSRRGRFPKQPGLTVSRALDSVMAEFLKI